MSRSAALLLVLIFLTASCASSIKPTLAVSENFWTIKASMPTARVYFGVAVVNDKIYAFGGTNGSRLNVSETYDPETDTWTAKTQMPTARNSFGISVVQNKIYVIGGQDIAIENVDTVAFTGVNEVYDPETDAWTTKASMPIPVVGYSSAVVDDKIYVIGGSDVNLTQIYDPRTDTWSNGAPIPQIVAGAGAGATTGVLAPKRIYVVGGYISSSEKVTDLTQIYDPKSDVWSAGASISKARLGLCLAVVDDVLFAIGGATAAMGIVGPKYDINERYVPFGYGTPDPSAPLPSPEAQDSEPFPVVPVAAAFAASVAVVGVALLAYFRKRSHQAETQLVKNS